MDANQIPGMSELTAVADALSNARYAYDAASNHGYPVREARAVSAAEEAYKSVVVLYPVAAAYRKATSWERASNYRKSAAGRRAAKRILDGEDHTLVLSEMETEWSNAANQAVANA